MSLGVNVNCPHPKYNSEQTSAHSKTPQGQRERRRREKTHLSSSPNQSLPHLPLTFSLPRPSRELKLPHKERNDHHR